MFKQILGAFLLNYKSMKTTRRSAPCLLREPIKEHHMATRNSSAPAPSLLHRHSVLHHCIDLFAVEEIPAMLFFFFKKE